MFVIVKGSEGNGHLGSAVVEFDTLLDVFPDLLGVVLHLFPEAVEEPLGLIGIRLVAQVPEPVGEFGQEISAATSKSRPGQAVTEIVMLESQPSPLVQWKSRNSPAAIA